MKFNALIPEFAVTDIQASLSFYRDLLGFAVAYERLEEGFAMLTIGDAQLMLDEIGAGRTFDDTPLDRPFGRGLNLQIEIDAEHLDSMLARLRENDVRLYLEPEERWYRTDAGERGQRQFVVADPDGYLLRFMTPIWRTDAR